MNFLNVGPLEITVILILAILLVGPQRMVELARTIGRATTQMRKLSGEFFGTIQAELQATEQEVRQTLDSAAGDGQESIASLPDEIQTTQQETHQVLEDIGKDEREATTSIKTDLQAVERETRQVMKEIVESVEGIVKGKHEV